MICMSQDENPSAIPGLTLLSGADDDSAIQFVGKVEGLRAFAKALKGSRPFNSKPLFFDFTTRFDLADQFQAESSRNFHAYPRLPLNLQIASSDWFIVCEDDKVIMKAGIDHFQEFEKCLNRAVADGGGMHFLPNIALPVHLEAVKPCLCANAIYFCTKP